MVSQLHVLYPMPSILGTTKTADQVTTVSSVAVAPTGYTAAVAGGGGCDLVTFDVQGFDVRCRWDGVDPTAAIGHRLYAGSGYTWAVSQYNASKFIAVTSDAVVHASAMKV